MTDDVKYEDYDGRDHTEFMYWIRRDGQRAAGQVSYPLLLPAPRVGDTVTIEGLLNFDADPDDDGDLEEFVVTEVRWHYFDNGTVHLWACMDGQSLDNPATQRAPEAGDPSLDAQSSA